ncbi:MAG: hypothetical protein ACTHU0_26460 [Kofleriaceae bacterium]
MLAIVASARDRTAAALVARWADRRARLLSPRDLSRPGWRHHVGGRGEEWAVIGGEHVRASELRGVVARLPVVREEDLRHVVSEDREYVAAEMSAFLLSWLTSLPCPVLNRPTTTSLMGPNLSHERWLVLAARAGLSIAGGRVQGADVERPRVAGVVTVVGDRWVGDVSPVLGDAAVRVARAAGIALCTVRFDGADEDARFVDAELFTELEDPRIADALLAHFDERGPA